MSATNPTPDPLAYGPSGYRCGCGKDAHSNLVPCQPTAVPLSPEREELASLAVNAANALSDEKRHYQIAAEENARLREELAARQEDIAFLERNTLPELRRTAQSHEDGKKRWRTRAEKAEAENARLLSERQETNSKLVERDVALKAAEKRIAELEGAETGTEYGIRFSDGRVLDRTWSRKESDRRLAFYRDRWPDAHLVQRTVRNGEWTEIR